MDTLNIFYILLYNYRKRYANWIVYARTAVAAAAAIAQYEKPLDYAKQTSYDCHS